MGKGQKDYMDKNEPCGLKFKRRPGSPSVVVIESNLKDLNVDVQALVTKLVTIKLKGDGII